LGQRCEGIFHISIERERECTIYLRKLSKTI